MKCIYLMKVSNKHNLYKIGQTSISANNRRLNLQNKTGNVYDILEVYEMQANATKKTLETVEHMTQLQFEHRGCIINGNDHVITPKGMKPKDVIKLFDVAVERANVIASQL